MSTSPRPLKRTTTTCVTCRARKVRCDGRREVCANCERLGFGCSYDETVGVEVVSISGNGSGGGVSISVPRRRVRQACQNCHARKARCSGSVPSCDRCRAQGLECVYRPGKRSLPPPLPPSRRSPVTAAGAAATASALSPAATAFDDVQAAANGSGTPASSTASPRSAGMDQADPDDALALRAFDNFFRHVHHIAMFSFLHRPSVMERYHAGSLDRALVLALIGITALLVDLGPGTAEYGNRCVDEAVSLCLADLEKPSIPRLQALVLAVKHRMLSKRLSGAFMLHAVASRFATALRLNHEMPNLCFLARESRRRLMWSIYMIDSSISAGQPEYALWGDAERLIHVQLPCNERNFDFDLPEPTEPLRPPAPEPGGAPPPLPDVLGLMALHVRIHWMRSRILECTSRVAAASPSEDALALLPSQCAELAAELAAFEARLPASFRGCEANFRLRSYSSRLGIFVMTHVWWRQCHLDLYRLFLPGLREALAPVALQQLDAHFVMHKRQSCYEHARAMADMFSQLLTLGRTTPVSDLDLPGCAFQCVRVLYHGLQTSGGELGFTRERVQELATVCLRVAQQSTPGPASAAVQADIDGIIANGLQLPEVPFAFPGRTRALAAVASVDTPYFEPPPMPHEEQQHHVHAMPASAVQMTMPESTVAPPPIPMSLSLSMAADATLAASTAHSHASGGTSTSNAFEEVADGLNLGLEMFGTEAWSTLPHDWVEMGHFAPGSGM